MSNETIMKTYLISHTNTTSEWLNNFTEVQEEMNRLEKSGIVSSVNVQQFTDNVLTQQITYNYNGTQWEK